MIQEQLVREVPLELTVPRVFKVVEEPQAPKDLRVTRAQKARSGHVVIQEHKVMLGKLAHRESKAQQVLGDHREHQGQLELVETLATVELRAREVHEENKAV